MSGLLSDNLLLFAWNLTWLLMLSIIVLFLLICHKHYQRGCRYRIGTEIDSLLKQLTDPELFHDSNVAFHQRVRHYFQHNYIDLLYAWTRQCQKLSGTERIIYCNNAARCSLFEKIPDNLCGHDSAKICIALEVCGLANMIRYTALVEPYSWEHTYAPFACHALVRMNFAEGMECLLRAYGHQYVNNGELLTICSEYSKEQLQDWAIQSTRWPLPEVLRTHWITA